MKKWGNYRLFSFGGLLGHRYTARAELRHVPEGVDVQFLVDGRRVGTYRGPASRLSRSTHWPIDGDDTHVRLGCNKAAVFSRAVISALEPLSAPGTPTPAAAGQTAAAAPFDIRFTAVDGREVDLAKLRGKVVLVDFWATWCGPCIGELPRVLDAYQKFHDRGFEIIGISFDQDKGALQKMVKDRGMTWPQYFDGKGWKNDFGVKYNIHGIPTMWLIDKQGRIATTDARQDLAGQVDKLLAANVDPSAGTVAAPSKGGGSASEKSSGVETLPWEKDYASALAKAKAEKRPIFLMLTATWCGPCRALESQTLPDPLIREALKEFVWVQAFEDKELNAKHGLSGYPTLVFLDAEKERALAQTSGYQEPGPFLKPIIEARRAANLPLTPEMQKAVAASFEPDHRKLDALSQAGDVDGLIAYLQPVAKDVLRKNNYLVLQVHLPSGLAPAEVVCLASRNDVVLNKAGLSVVSTSRTGRESEVRVVAPGYRAIQDRLQVSDSAAVQSREYQLEPLSAQDAVSFSGRVLLPSGEPAAQTIVRICDWGAVTRTDQDGRFQINGVSPGKFLVRAERPGGEFHSELEFTPGAKLTQDLRLQAVTTVGLRWALQTEEGVRTLTGKGVRTGEAYFSVDHSRFLLERGAQTRVYWGSDLMLDDWSERLRQYVKPDAIAAMEKAPSGTPVFWLFDATSLRRTGLHRETAQFDDVTSSPPKLKRR